MSDGELAVAAALVFSASLGLEAAALRWRRTPWFAFGFPLGHELVPLPARPEGEGRTRALRWEVAEGGAIVRWWADPEAGLAPRGLHGLVRMRPEPPGRVHLEVWWAPAWTPLLAAVWLVGVGASRGEGAVVGPLGALWVGVVLYVGWTRALAAAAELRFGLARALDQSGASPGAQGGRPS